MSFLTINGKAISVANCRKSFEEVGDREPAFDGSARSSIRVRKRVWDLETALLSEIEAAELEGVLLGLGHLFHFDSDMYSTKGLSGDGTPTGTVHSATAADGRTVYNVGKFSGGFEADKASTNLLAADDRDAEGSIAGFLAVDGATITQDSTYYWQGTKSVKVVTSGTINGVRGGVYVQDTGNSATTRYTASAYVLSTGATTLRLRFRDNTNGTETIVTQAVAANVWYRIICTHLTGAAGAVTLQLFVEENTADSAVTFYVDGLQIEQSEYATSWVDGTRAAADLFLVTPSLLNTAQDFTIAFWTKGPQNDPDSTSINTYAFYAGPASGTHPYFGIQIFRDLASPQLVQIDTTNSAGSGYTRDASITLDGTTWHHVVAVLRRNRESGEVSHYLYWDGALVNSGTSANVPSPSEIGLIAIGSKTDGTYHIRGLIDELMILPYAVTASLVAAWYARTAAFALHPRFLISGDIVGAGTSAAEVTCVGEVQDSTVVPWQDGTVFRNNGRRVRFKLREV